MKKVLVSLLVLAVAVSGAFAVSFTGSLTAGYAFGYNDGDWSGHVFGNDDADSNTTTLKLKFADDNGIWEVETRGIVASNYRMNANLTVNFDKLIWGPDTNVKLALALIANDNQVALRAYHNGSGNNFDRIRTASNGLFGSLTVGYGNLIQVKVAGTPKTEVVEDGNAGNGSYVNGYNESTPDITVSALTKPINGIAVSAGWIYAGDTAARANRNGKVAVAADVNIGTLVGLDFDLGVSASYKFNYDAEGTYDIDNLVAAEVYFGMGIFDIDVEYALIDRHDADTEHYLYAGVGFDFGKVSLSAWTGANNIAKYGDTWFVGAEAEYNFYGNLSFGLCVEYAEEDSDSARYVGGGFGHGVDGFSIIPYFSLSF